MDAAEPGGGAPPKAPVAGNAPAAPTATADPIPDSEKVGGTFRKQFLKLLAKGGGELPDGWQAHHELIERLKDQWKTLGLDWNTVSTTNGLGVPALLNTEFNTLYEAWLKEFKIGDPTKMTKEQLEKFRKEFEKLNAAIRELYKDYIILPSDTLDTVVKKREAWHNALHPNGKEVAGDTDAWQAKQKDRFDAIWKLIRAK